MGKAELGGGGAHPEEPCLVKPPLRSPPKPQPDHPPLAPLLIERLAPRPRRAPGGCSRDIV